MKNAVIMMLACMLVTLAACSNSGSSSSPPAAQPKDETPSISSYESGSEPSSSQPEKIKVPDFTLESSEGDSVALSDHLGKVVVLNMWASWCPPCKSEMPDFQKLYEEIKDSDDVVLLMLNQLDGKRETKAKALDYISKNSFTFPILYDDGTVSYGIFGSQSIPVTVVIDKEGNFYDAKVGITEYDKVINMIEGAKDA